MELLSLFLSFSLSLSLSLSLIEKYHTRLSSSSNWLRQGYFENKEKKLLAELQLILNKKVLWVAGTGGQAVSDPFLLII